MKALKYQLNSLCLVGTFFLVSVESKAGLTNEADRFVNKGAKALANWQ